MPKLQGEVEVNCEEGLANKTKQCVIFKPSHCKLQMRSKSLLSMVHHNNNSSLHTLSMATFNDVQVVSRCDNISMGIWIWDKGLGLSIGGNHNILCLALLGAVQGIHIKHTTKMQTRTGILPVLRNFKK